VIGCFPDPHPDELLYSTCARLQDRMNYRNKETINTELFGSRGISSVIALPSYLEYLVSNLPPTTTYTVDEIIDNHTLLPYYAPFLPTERVKRLREEMRSSKGSGVHSIFGIASGKIRAPDWLRFCYLCVLNDRNKFGECYWHRLHQIPSVLVCPIHNTFLENGSVRLRNRINTSAYVSAEQSISVRQPCYLDSTNSEHQILLNIALNTSWLLAQPQLQTDYSYLYSYYLTSFIEQGFGFGFGKISLIKLIQALRDKYSRSLLSSLQCDFDEHKKFNWPSNILTRLNQGRGDPPIRHILLIQLLGHTANSFFSRFAEGTLLRTAISKPFGDGPWPCLNQICPNYNQAIIKTCQVRSGRPPNTRPSGTFSCSHCGFIYFRKALNKATPNNSRSHRVKSYGPLWESALRKLWRDSSKSIKELSDTLGSSYHVIRDMAIRLGLPFPRVGLGHRVMHVSPDYQQQIEQAHYKKSRTGKSETIMSMRNAWLSVRQQFRDATRSHLLHRIAPATYTYLYKHDQKWLVAHLPPLFRRAGSARQVDWVSRDIKLEKEVRASAIHLKRASGRPIQVTKRAIGRDIDEMSTIRSPNALRKLPLTSQALTEVVETQVQFAIRRIRWAAECFRQENIFPTWSKLGRRAGIDHSFWYEPEVINAFESALHSLRQIDNISAVEAA
jgi:hypothetical protein